MKSAKEPAVDEVKLESLRPHPENANRMDRSTFGKLVEHVRESGQYPPIVVRPHPVEAGAFEVLDGHHRVEALRELGHETATCVTWEVDDKQARMLLLTLNRLHGEDDPRKRGALLKRLRESFDEAALAKRLPEDAERIRRLIRLTDPPEAMVEPPEVDSMVQAITFFLTGAQRRALVERLRPLARDRSEALVALLGLSDEHDENRGEAQ